ncbi:hypothetical protein CPB83DRAFT_462980 [Crepidotus variabilis]|uniref:Uncharacterized protein n=1 Tax=Crepidotus variabilis TaxID=179855 RepID=A0A9P6ECH6_9AGAR|nr:hypothetical protein CPB83DRAFT_462980 [Crepidotus variabilis]
MFPRPTFASQQKNLTLNSTHSRLHRNPDGVLDFDRNWVADAWFLAPCLISILHHPPNKCLCPMARRLLAKRTKETGMASSINFPLRSIVPTVCTMRLARKVEETFTRPDDQCFSDRVANAEPHPMILPPNVTLNVRQKTDDFEQSNDDRSILRPHYLQIQDVRRMTPKHRLLRRRKGRARMQCLMLVRARNVLRGGKNKRTFGW